MTDTHTISLDANNTRVLTEAVARQYGNIRELTLVIAPETSTLTTKINGREAATVAYTTQAANPVDRLLELRQMYFNGGRDRVQLEEVMSLLEPAYQRLSTG